MKKTFALKKILMALVAALCTAFSAGSEDFSENLVQQVLIPREVYVGDSASVEYSFRSPVDFFALARPEQIQGDTLNIDVNQEVFRSVEDKCTITQVLLLRNGLSYNFIIDLIPWKPGEIDFPEFDLATICVYNNPEASFDNRHSVYSLDLEPITIASIVEHLGVSTIRKPESPAVLPGTNYVLWTFIVVSAVIVVFAFIFIIRFKKIKAWFLNVRERHRYRKNAHKTKRRFRQLMKSDLSDADYSAEWQNTMKRYLAYRFRTQFGSVTSKKIPELVEEVSQGKLTPGQKTAIEYITSVFIRTDYIRFARDSIESKLLPVEEHSAAFTKGERKSISDMSESAVTRLEINHLTEAEEKEEIRKAEAKAKKAEGKKAKEERIEKIKKVISSIIRKEQNDD